MLVCSADTPKALHICALRRLPSLGADFLARDFDGNQAFHCRALAATTLYGPHDKLLEHTMIIAMLGCGADINAKEQCRRDPSLFGRSGSTCIPRRDIPTNPRSGDICKTFTKVEEISSGALITTLSYLGLQ